MARTQSDLGVGPSGARMSNCEHCETIIREMVDMNAKLHAAEWEMSHALPVAKAAAAFIQRKIKILHGLPLNPSFMAELREARTHGVTHATAVLEKYVKQLELGLDGALAQLEAAVVRAIAQGWKP